MPTPGPQPVPHIRLAEAALRAGNPQRAASICQAILRAKPNDAEAHHALGRILMRAGQAPAARNHLTRATALQPANPLFLQSLAEHLFACTDYTGALTAYERLTRLNPSVPDPHVEVAALHDALGAPDEAREALLRALALDPNHPRALTLHVKLAMQGPDKLDQAKLAEFRSTLERISSETRDPTTKALSARLLAQVDDRLADYDAAFAAYTLCNRTDASTRFAPPARMRDGYLKALAEMEQAITRERAQRWTVESPGDGFPSPAFLVGFPGSGTTLLERALGAHPRLVALDERPTLFHAKSLLLDLPPRNPFASRHIADIIDGLAPDQVTTLRREYWRRVDEHTGPRPDGALVLDKMPLCITDLPFINRIFPEARVIVALRDPRDACLSCYIKRFVMNIPMSFFLDLHDTARLYEHVMGAWLRTRDLYTLPWMESRYEDVLADFPARARDALSFLGLEWDDAVTSFYDSTAKDSLQPSTSTLNYQAVRRTIDTSAAGRWRRYERHIAPILPTLQPFIESFGYADG